MPGYLINIVRQTMGGVKNLKPDIQFWNSGFTENNHNQLPVESEYHFQNKTENNRILSDGNNNKADILNTKNNNPQKLHFEKELENDVKIYNGGKPDFITKPGDISYNEQFNTDENKQPIPIDKKNNKSEYLSEERADNKKLREIHKEVVLPKEKIIKKFLNETDSGNVKPGVGTSAKTVEYGDNNPDGPFFKLSGSRGAPFKKERKDNSTAQKVQVNIGMIEIRAVQDNQVEKKKIVSKRNRILSLDAYLKQRSNRAK